MINANKLVIILLVFAIVLIAILYFIVWQFYFSCAGYVYDGKCTVKSPSVMKEVIKVKLYFSNSKMDPEYSCNKVFSIDRSIFKTQSVARAALEELLKGPAETEKSAGFFTSINPGVKIQSLRIENGTAYVDFDEQLEKAIGGSCKVSAIRAEIVQTLQQFPTVKNVVISINGRVDDILQP